MKAFISFDFNWYHTNQGTQVGQKIAQYANNYPTSQLYVDGKIFASSFAGDGVDVNAIRTAAGAPIFWAPNFHPEQGTNFGTVDGALNWMVRRLTLQIVCMRREADSRLAGLAEQRE